MYIRSLRLANFKSYTGEENLIEFSPAVNYLVGNNNSGKSTILEAIDFIRNNNYDTEELKAVNPTGDQFYVEMALKGKKGEIAELMDTFADPKKAITLKKYIIDDEYIVVKRCFDSKDSAKSIRFLAPNKDTNTSESHVFENPAGIDAPFKSFFTPTLFRATDTPTDIIDFGSTKILGKLINHETDGFFESDAWAQFQKAHHETFSSENGYINRLASLATLLGDMTSEHFNKGSIKISFNFTSPDPIAFVKQGHLTVDDGSASTSLESKGNGLQRAVAFSIIRLYADMLRSDGNESADISQGLFLCVDEPEIWMHPKAQQQLAVALNTISATEQVFIATHSPYMLQSFNVDPENDAKSKKQIEDKLYICLGSGEPRSTSRFEPSKDLGHIHPGNPSLAEITYFAFQMATPEFHNELVGYIQSKLGINDLVSLDALFMHEYGMRQQCRRFDSRCFKGNNCFIACETLPIHIRNLIDHPEGIGKKQDVLGKIKEDPSWLNQYSTCTVCRDHENCDENNKCKHYKKCKRENCSLCTVHKECTQDNKCAHCKDCKQTFTLEDIKSQTNSYTQKELEESILLLLNVIQKNPQWTTSTSTQENVPVSRESVR